MTLSPGTRLGSLARFEREAKVLASLNHVRIAQIYGVEHSGETRALVMERNPTGGVTQKAHGYKMARMENSNDVLVRSPLS